ncbi:MAG: cellobiose phosphorylase [Candidatus Omnitrophica bacterium]|nr:cellobiose phosphorylase [Candidatus Omnitrophota bacterium]
MREKLWKFTDDKGTFVSSYANRINSLYFPLCNSLPFMSSITPDLKGDIKKDYNHFLLEPVSRIGLNNSKASRNFWVYLGPKTIWSATGVSKDASAIKKEGFKLEAGLLWHKVSRINNRIGLKAEITSFIPASNEALEVMYVKITNVCARSIRFTPTAAIPIYGRSAHNLHDHRHVTSLLNRVKKDRSGVILKPTLLFDEAGHKKNDTFYFVLGVDEKSRVPRHIFLSQEEFCGMGGDLEAPKAVFENTVPDKDFPSQGKEAMGALRFQERVLAPKAFCSYLILIGISKEEDKIKTLLNRFNGAEKIKKSLKLTENYWQKNSGRICLNTKNKTFDNWLRWVNIQPALRRIFGCSYLPDFDYGKGGRGWRDLWQDCLYLTLIDPKETRSMLTNNFCGVRIDGSNATIIGSKPAEFLADRNNISRTWMDHGAWPLLTTRLYIDQSADIKVVFEKLPYFKDKHLSRNQQIDENWNPRYGTSLKTRDKKVYKGTLLEHLLVENLVQFFNVGPHNYIRLENADWNDGLDMAARSGESVAFTCFYAQNLTSLSELVERSAQKNIAVLQELGILIDSLSKDPVNYSSPAAKQKALNKYFEAVRYEISGKKISLPKDKLIRDLKRKADWLGRHIQRNAWLKEGFFNGYYDNNKKRLEGRFGSRLGMTLTGQVFPIMSGIAVDKQIRTVFKNAKRYLWDKDIGGFRLNSDFGREQLTLGRAFSFIYGDKENGAFFNHMSVMFAYALYSRGFAKEGFRVLDSIYAMATASEKNRIYPCLPEYFDSRGCGMYSYLTGSASWFMFTLLTQVFGIKGEYGNLAIEPKLVRAQFKDSSQISISASFAGKNIEIKFINTAKKDFGKYSIRKLILNKKDLAQDLNQRRFLIKRRSFLKLCNKKINLIEVILD